MKKALITGISGQDGSYLAEFLLDKGYEVHGMVRRSSVPENQSYRINHIYDNPKLKLHYGDLEDISSIVHILQDVRPDELYNLAAQSHVRISYDKPIYTCTANAIGTLNLLESIRIVDTKIKMYQASSSEMFGNNIDDDGYQRETTTLDPVSPYGCSKVFGYNITRNYRNAYDMFISNGILFNHESPRRGINFVTNKVCKSAVDIYRGDSDKLFMGNLDATRDWGHSKDYVEAMWMMLQHDKPDDFVCATGKSHSVKDLCKYVFDRLGMDYEDYVVVDKKYLRPEELKDLKGDSTKIRETLGWKPKYTFETMIDEMVDYWLEKTPMKK